MALDQLAQCFCGGSLGNRLSRLLLVCRELRQLQQNIRVTGRGGWFMTWICISTIIILIGGELNAEIEHKMKRDATTGPEQPQDRRGATKSDNTATA